MTDNHKPVIFQRPDNWASMTRDEKVAFASAIAEAMGFKDEAETEPDSTSDDDAEHEF